MKLLLTGWLVFAITVGISFGAESRSEQWKRVETATQQSLPKSALELLPRVLESALADKAWGDVARAIALKVQLEGTIQGNRPEEKIKRLISAVESAPVEVKPILETLLAHWYWHYFQQNRWRFLQRTASSQPIGDDFTTWDLSRLFAEIDRHFTAALRDDAILRSTPVATFDGVLVKGTVSDLNRPTIYDFIAHEALQFYSSGEQAGARPQETTQFRVDDLAYGLIPLFGTAEEFARTAKIERRGDESMAEKAFFLYRDLLNFHSADRDPTAFIDADISRLVWVKNVVVGDAKDAAFRDSMMQVATRWTDHELSSLALHHVSQALKEEGKWAEAREVALRGEQRHRLSPGAKLCRNLIDEIEAPSVLVSTESVWLPAGKPIASTIAVRYRNIDQIWLRLIASDWTEYIQRQGGGRSEARREILTRKAAWSGSYPLAKTEDFHERSTDLTAPVDLPPGFYMVVASCDADFNEAKSPLSLAAVWISDLALITRPRAGHLEGFVLDAISGEPIPGAKVQVFRYLNNTQYQEVAAQETDSLGVYQFEKLVAQNSCLVRATVGGRQVATTDPTWWSERVPLMPERRTLLFTDRSLYRPGQTIYYKGICVYVDQERDDYQLRRGEEVVAILSDSNGQEVARAKHRVNDFGSFAGSFTAPRDRGTGQMSIREESVVTVATWINVEEYKRPKFQVQLIAPQEPARLGGSVMVKGTALAYTGAPVDGAEVKWRVMREVRYPVWWGWIRGRDRQPRSAEEIGNGSGRSDAQGAFQIAFTARPDPSAAEADEPVFTFSVSADVTDANGETRSDRRVIQVGYTALAVDVTTQEWQTTDQPVELLIQTHSLENQPIAAAGQLKVYQLRSPENVQRPRLTGPYKVFDGTSSKSPDLSNPNEWPLGNVVIEQAFATDALGVSTNRFHLGVGAFRALLETRDPFGKTVKAVQPLLVVDRMADRCAIKVPNLVIAPRWSGHPGETLLALWGTGYAEGRALVEIEHRDRLITRYWTAPGKTQQPIQQEITEAMRGGFTIHVTQVRENRAFLDSHSVDVPWDNRELKLRWEHFVSKLEPGQKDTWTLVAEPVTPVVAGEKTAATSRLPFELVAALYDASLDQYLPHGWNQNFEFFRKDYSQAQGRFANAEAMLKVFLGAWPARHDQAVDLRYRTFSDQLAYFNGRRPPGRLAESSARGRSVMRQEMAAGGVAAAAPAAADFALASPAPADSTGGLADAAGAGAQRASKDATVGPAASAGLNLATVSARKNLNETAFFLPQLTSDSNGVFRISFTMPEALTEWKFLGFVHDGQLRSGGIEDRTVTVKDLMVQPNSPRFVREGDTLEFPVKVSNRSASSQKGKVRLNFQLMVSGDSADGALENQEVERDFDIPRGESRSFSWHIRVPDGLGYLSYKAVASTGKVSDGEEGYLPVLSRRTLITESLSLPIRGPGTKTFSFTSLRDSGNSKTLRHEALSVQMVSRPAWYAVLALPYLMEFPQECSEQTFNRLYANALARHIANSDPKVKAVFDQWRATPTLQSPLEKNPELKSVAIAETPWWREAKDETRARQQVGLLFDSNRMDYETEKAFRTLSEMQLPDGRWPWFPGGPGNDFITLYVTCGFGRLRHLSVDVSVEPALRSLARLDAWMDEQYRDLRKTGSLTEMHLNATISLYLYTRSFFLTDRPLAPEAKEAVDYWLGQAVKYWTQLDNRQSQAHLALALKRWGNAETPKAIVRSLRERAISNDEMGMFWRDTELNYWWYRAPIETQALMAEMFDEVAGDSKAVEDCKVWLLKQKQTQDWKTTKATADAIYALLLRGTELLNGDALVEVELGGRPVRSISNRPSFQAQPPPEPGTGYYETRLVSSEITPSLSEITVKKSEAGIAWGSVHWQYFEDLSQVKASDTSPLKISKGIFVRSNSPKGPLLNRVSGPIAVGDELVVRLELRVDRDMEYVHLKDQRGSGTEPINVLSQYKYQDGLAYYESTRDTATHFFIDYLPKGTYVFEYSSRVQHRGEYQSGTAEIQCMYAPEFNSHSGSTPIVVR